MDRTTKSAAAVVEVSRGAVSIGKDVRPIVAVMMGDPAGIGPEISVKALASANLSGDARYLLIGNLAVAQSAAKVSGLNVQFCSFPDFEALEFRPGVISVLDRGNFDPQSYQYGKSAVSCGKAVLEWMADSIKLGETAQVNAVVHAPVDTKAIYMTGITQDDFLHQVDDIPGVYQLRCSGPLRAVPISEHVRMRDVHRMVTRNRVFEVVKLLHSTLAKWGLPDARIAVAGLNPHAMFEEDRDELVPAVQDAQALGLRVDGPVTPDAVFRQAMTGQYDAIVTMYHDQGQIPLKTAAFEGACTVYLGLGYIRVGTPHGTAFDIAGSGKAQHFTMLAAINTAAALANGKGFLDSRHKGDAPEAARVG